MGFEMIISQIFQQEIVLPTPWLYPVSPGQTSNQQSYEVLSKCLKLW